MRLALALVLLPCAGLSGLRCQQAPGDLGTVVAEAAAAIGQRDMAGARTALDAVLAVASSQPAGLLDQPAVEQLLVAVDLARACGRATSEATLLDRLVAAVADRPATDRDRLLVMSRKAMALVATGALEPALTMQRDVERVLATEFGPDDARLHMERARMARTLRSMGRFEDALAMGSAAVGQLERLLPADATDLQVARGMLAITKKRSNDMAGALSLLRQADEILERTLPADDLELQFLRADLAGALLENGDPSGGPLQQQALVAMERILEDQHPYLQVIRTNVARELCERDPRAALPIAERALATLVAQVGAESDVPVLCVARITTAACRRECGDLVGARALDEQAVHVLARRAEQDPYLVAARLDLAETLRARSDLIGALDVQERLVAALARSPGHSMALQAQSSLAVTLSRLGDWSRASAIDANVLAALQSMPITNLARLRAEASVAWDRTQTGDPTGALDLQEHVLDVLLQRGEEDTPLFLAVQSQLAGTRSLLGDFAGALALQRTVIAVRAAKLPADAPLVLTAKADAAISLAQLRDFPAAMALQRSILEARSQHLADTDTLLQSARTNLAFMLLASGNAAGAVKLQRQVVALADVRKDRPIDLQLARARLAMMLQQTGETHEAAGLLDESLDALERAGAFVRPEAIACLAAGTHSLIAIGDGVGAVRRGKLWASVVRSRLAQGSLSPRETGMWCRANEGVLDALGSLVAGTPTRSPVPGLGEEFLLAAEAMRGVEVQVARLARRANATRKTKEVQSLQASWQDAACRLAETLRCGAASDAAAVRELVEARDRAQRHLRELASSLRGYDPATVTAAHLAAHLPEHAAAVSLRCHGLTSAAGASFEWRVLASVLAPDGTVTSVPLGRLDGVQRMAEELAKGGIYSTARLQLRKQVIEPILAVLPAHTQQLVLGVDDALQLVPWDALELASGQLLGEVLRVQQVDSLFELLDAEPSPTAAVPLLGAFGGIDYGSGAVVAASSGRSGSAPDLLSMPVFTALPHTGDEVREVAEVFRSRLPECRRHLVVGREASKSALEATASQATFLHLATHGYFLAQAADGRRVRAVEDVAGFQREGQNPALGLAPLTLCGLALAGANEPRVTVGARSGLESAEELLAMDLSYCELAVLSACEGSAGLLQQGRGLASLRAGLRGAGARFVIVSLWHVDDAATRQLMVDFYRHLLDQPAEARDPGAALWAARLAARDRGAAFRDWAGWVVVGR
jgi:CHAT domain-containing protein/tetratricopeptide (TPR) repeat protein